MSVNASKTQTEWKKDTDLSVAAYNAWYRSFAAQTFSTCRGHSIKIIPLMMKTFKELRAIDEATLMSQPFLLQPLRMATCPPLARDRLSGFADVSKAAILSFEDGQLPSGAQIVAKKLCAIINAMLDTELFPWLAGTAAPSQLELESAIAVIVDRFTMACADPIIRNEQEQRQQRNIAAYLKQLNYREVGSTALEVMAPGTYQFIAPGIGQQENGTKKKIPIDMAIQRHTAKQNDIPLLIEAKSAGDFTNTNKRRKEEVTKVAQLKKHYGPNTELVLYLFGYFDATYLGAGLDFFWDHRLSDLAGLGV